MYKGKFVAELSMNEVKEYYDELRQIYPLTDEQRADFNILKEKLIAFAYKVLEQEPILDKLKSEIERKIEQERFSRSVFRGEEKDAVKAEQCTGSIFAYNNVTKLIDKYKAEEEEG